MPVTLPTQRSAIVNAASEHYERFIAFAIERATAVDPTWIPRFEHGAARGREDLRFAPRDGDVADEVLDHIEQWFGVIDAWLTDTDSTDLEALAHWSWEWPSLLRRELLFVGLRNPDGLDQACYELRDRLPTGSSLLITIGPEQLHVRADLPSREPIEFERFIGTSRGVGAALSSVVGSLSAALRERESGR